jgi:Pretoxin HINT domain
VPIESLSAGDHVLAFDPETGTASTAAVSDAYAREVPGVIAIAIGRVTISVTCEHPFWVPGDGWRSAGELSAGTTLQCQSGRGIAVTTIARHDRPTTVHNLTVDGVSTYFVSPVGVLVHNKSRGRRPAPTEAELPAAKAEAQASTIEAETRADGVIDRARGGRRSGRSRGNATTRRTAHEPRLDRGGRDARRVPNVRRMAPGDDRRAAEDHRASQARRRHLG